MRAEPEIKRDAERLTGLLEQFCTRVVPWYYSNNSTAPKGRQKTRDGADLFFPALWREKTVVAYSPHGYQAKTWQLPPGWEDVKNVDVCEITLAGPKKLHNVAVRDGTITLGLAAGQGVMSAP
jgi:hypothetical protein